MSIEDHSQQAHESETTPAEQPMAINNGMIQRAFALLANRRVSRSEEHFLISTETIDHSDMGEYIPLLLEQYKNADDEVQDFIQRMMFNEQGQQYVKAIVAGAKDRFSLSVIASCRITTDIIDQHKILIATMKKSVEMSAVWNLVAELFSIKSDDQKELEDIVSKLNDEENKKYLEIMALQLLGDNIRIFLSDAVRVRAIENNSDDTPPIATASSST